MSFDKKNVFEKLRSVKKSIRLAVWCPAIALALGTAGCSTKSDYDLIQGAWRIEGKDERCVFAVETMSMESRDGDKKTSLYRLDPSKTPKAIDIIHQEGSERGSTILGIYSIEGDTLRFCWASSVTAGRPTAFKEMSGADLAVMKREKR